MIWKILEIEKTKDEEIIRNAYRNKLRYVNPEDDEAGFKELRRAFEEAMEYANKTDEEENEEEAFRGKKNEVDLWIDRVEKLYKNAITRCDEKEWKTLLSDSVCESLDTEIEAAEKLLVFFMSHTHMPQNIMKLVDSRFHYIDNYQRLVERFPENYLAYIRWIIENEGYIDFRLFDGKTDDHIDEYIDKIHEANRLISTNELDSVPQILKELNRYDVTHPYMNVQEARYYLAKAKTDNNELEYEKKALQIMEDLDFEYSDNMYIEKNYADALLANNMVEKAQKIYEMVVEENPSDYSAALGIANCIYQLGDIEDAKEKVEDVLDEQVHNPECMALLEQMNEKLVEKYQESLQNEKNVKIACKLGWCYYQQQKFEEGIKLLDEYDNLDEYDYVNLRCRLYLATEKYELAYPLVKIWMNMIQNTVDDGSREMRRRVNRLTLAQFSLAICMWEMDYQNGKDEESKKKARELSIEYIKKAISGENNRFVKLSYMDQYARFYLNAKEYENCIEVCTEIIGMESEFFPAYVERQKANYELKNAKEVIDDYFICKEIYPEYIQPYLYAAEVFYAFSQYDDVEQVIEDAKKAGLESDTLELYTIRVMHYKEFNQQNTERARKAIEEFRDKIYKKIEDAQNEGKEMEEVTDLKNLEELEREYALIYWDLDNDEMATSICNKYLEKNPDAFSFVVIKIDILNNAKKYDEALKLCKELVEKKPDEISYKVKLGNGYERASEYLEAIRAYKEVLSVDANNQQALRRLMYVYDILGDRENNINYYRTAITYSTRFIEVTNSSEGYLQRGNLLINLCEFEKAIEDCKKSIELDPEAFYAYNNLGCAYLKIRRIDEAIVPLLEAIKIDPERDGLPYLNLAECYTLQKRYDEAIEIYRKVMKIWPRRVALKEDIANCYAKAGDYTNAILEFLAIPQAFCDTWGDKKTDNAFVSNTIESYCDCIKKCSEYGEYKQGAKFIKRAMKALEKYKGDHFPDKIDNIIEFYRDMGKCKMAEKYAVKLMKIAKERNYNNDKQVLFAFATVLFENGKEDLAAKVAKHYLEKVLKGKNSEAELFEDKRYVAVNAFNFAIMHICMGEVAKAESYIEKITECTLCATCLCCDCFEYYFAKGYIAELKKDYELAITLYEKAIEVKGQYACAKGRLEQLKRKK